MPRYRVGQFNEARDAKSIQNLTHSVSALVLNTFLAVLKVYFLDIVYLIGGL